MSEREAPGAALVLHQPVPQDICCVRTFIPARTGMVMCCAPVVYLTAEQAQAAGRGPYSGWRHHNPLHDQEGHTGVPKRMVS